MDFLYEIVQLDFTIGQKYVFENEKNQEVVVSFPFFSDKETILSDPLVPNQEYNLAYDVFARVSCPKPAPVDCP